MHVKTTWGRRCNKLLFFSSEANQVAPFTYIGIGRSTFMHAQDNKSQTYSIHSINIITTIKELGSIGLDAEEGRDNLWTKTLLAFKFVYQHHKVLSLFLNIRGCF